MKDKFELLFHFSAKSRINLGR